MNKKLLVSFTILVLALFLLSSCIPRPAPPAEDTDEDGAVEEETETDATKGAELTKEETDKTAEEKEEMTEEKETGAPAKTVTEGELVEFPNLKATDPDGDPIKYTFSSPLDSKGRWQTKLGDAGEYKVTITASDGKNEVSQEVLITVKAKNRAPVITISDVSVDEGETIRLEPKVTDPDGDDVTITYSGWMEDDTYTTDYDDAGTQTVTIKATDGVNTVTKTVRILVKDVNRPPVFAENAFE